MQRMKKIFLVAIGLIVLSGCASIVSKSMYPVTVTSYPDGAEVIIQDERGKVVYKGETPTTVTLRSGESYFHSKRYKLIFSKSGYEKQYAYLESEMDGWYVGNILFGGLIGALIIDPITGAMWKLPKEINVNLEDDYALKTGERTLKIVTIDQVPDKLKNHLVRVN